MSFGVCPNCFNTLSDESALVTRPSFIFKGNNVYLMCKKCQQVLLYNVDRDMIFDLDEYKDDKEILDEINKLIAEVDSRYEVNHKQDACTHDCSTCSACDTQYKRAPEKKVLQQQKQEQEPTEEQEANNVLIEDTLSKCFLIVNKADPSQKELITEDKFHLIQVDEWIFFELNRVDVKPVISYEIVRH